MNISAPFIDTIALSLLHFLWQGAAIAALAGTLMLILRRPATRYLVGVGALVSMLVAFGTTVALLSGAGASEVLSARAPAAALASPKVADATPLLMLWTSQAATSPNAFAWMARAWFAGVLVFGLRIVFGLLAIERLRRRSLVALSPQLVARFEALQARLQIDRVIRYCQCDGVSVPAVIGVFRPIVLLPLRALTGLSAEQIDAVIAHELGHIQRFDVAVNFLQVLAETLLFFHPAVWWLNQRIRADREDCCDDVAVAACGGRVTYARALAAIETWRDAPSFAMAATGGTVAARVARLLGVNRGERGERATRAIAAMLVLTTALATGVMSLGLARPAVAQSSAPLTAESSAAPLALEARLPVPAVPALEAVPATPAVPALQAMPAVPAEPAVPAPGMLPPVPAVPESRVVPPPLPVPAAQPPEPPREATPEGEPKAADEAKARKEPKPAKAPKVGKEPKVAKAPKTKKEPKAAKEPKVDREERIETGQFERTEVHEEVKVEVNEEVRVNQNQNQNQNQNHNYDASKSGMQNSDIDARQREVLGISKGDLAAMQAMGISPDYVRAMGITPEDMRRAINLGFKNLTVEKLIQLELSSVL